MRIQCEKILVDQRASFAVREFRLPRFDAPLHVHPELELTYIVAGQGKRIVGDSVEDYGAGDLVLVGANLPHCWHTDLNQQADCGLAHSLVLQFNLAAFGETFWMLPEMAAIQRLFDAASRGLLIASVDYTFAQMQRLLNLEGSRRLLAMLDLLDGLAHTPGHKLLASLTFQPYADNRDYDRINRVYQYVFTHFADEVNLGEAATMLHMSKSAFCGYFLRRTRRTFSQFVTDIRIGHACNLLIETDRSVSDISYASGFKNLSNFNPRFRELRQVSPSVYRHQIGLKMNVL